MSNGSPDVSKKFWSNMVCKTTVMKRPLLEAIAALLIMFTFGVSDILAQAKSKASQGGTADYVIPLSFPEKSYECKQTGAALVTMQALRDAYYVGKGSLQTLVSNLFSGCKQIVNLTTQKYVIVFFVAKATPASTSTVVHFIYTVPEARSGGTTFAGVTNLTWVYVTSTKNEVPIVQLSITHADNPLASQVGKLVETIATPVGKQIVPHGEVSPAVPTTAPSLYLSVDEAVDVRFNRSTIGESDYIAQDGHEITGNATYSNTPLSRLTFNAGVVGVYARWGDRQMKIDNKTYASDPPNYVGTVAGVTIHRQFDSTAPTASAGERKGLFLGGVLTPVGGLAVAYSAGWRSFSIIAGYGLLFVKTAPSGKSIGDPAVSASDQLRTGYAHSILLGGSYSFGGS